MSHTKSENRAERLKAALRDNLKRRKAQARGRQASEKAEPDAEVADAPRRERGTD
jgi:hypothetical protein